MSRLVVSQKKPVYFKPEQHDPAAAVSVSWGNTNNITCPPPQWSFFISFFMNLELDDER